jgi:acyl-CoA thioesterase
LRSREGNGRTSHGTLEKVVTFFFRGAFFSEKILFSCLANYFGEYSLKENVCELLKERITKSPFARYMGMTILDIAPGYAKAATRYSEEMCNFNGLIHGAAIFALIDEVFGAAASSHGTMAAGLNMNVTFIKPPPIGSTLIAEAKEESRSKHTATYRIEVHENGENGDQIVAVCQALVYLKDKNLPFLGKEETD